MADAPLGLEVTVIRRRTLPSIVPSRNGKMDILTTYRTKDGATGSVMTPAEGDNELALAAAIRADLQEHSRWLNRTLKV